MRQKDRTFNVAVLILLLGFVFKSLNASPSDDDFDRCEIAVKEWASSSFHLEIKDDKHTLRDLLFFLHVPRTGGRSYSYCFLRKLYSTSQECPRSYDKLRFDPSKSNCRLLVTHDDYSVMSKLPKERTSVVTILRNPIDRVFSSYEFSVEVAARFLAHPNLTSAVGTVAQSKTKMTSTLDIWPWKYLVPWMREDLFARRDARKNKGFLSFGRNNPYDMKDIVMPLHEYINDPLAWDIIHNGATFQVAGITNNSYKAESHEVRHCVLKYRTLGEHVLEVAKKRLDNMLYVGLTEKHRESATMFANVVGAQVISQFTASQSVPDPTTKKGSEMSADFPEMDFDASNFKNGSTHQKERDASSVDNAEALNENMTSGKLMEAYATCISSLRTSHSQRRTASLKRIFPANFTREARLQVPEVLLQEITSYNSLDVELYKYAQDIYANQHKRIMQQLVSSGQDVIFKNSLGDYLRKVTVLAVSVFLLLVFVFLVVNARRRRSKLKL